jgi:hypothetical protein
MKFSSISESRVGPGIKSFCNSSIICNKTGKLFKNLFHICTVLFPVPLPALLSCPVLLAACLFFKKYFLQPFCLPNTLHVLSLSPALHATIVNLLFVRQRVRSVCPACFIRLCFRLPLMPVFPVFLSCNLLPTCLPVNQLYLVRSLLPVCMAVHLTCLCS